MLLSHSLKLIVTHTGKCAGSSVTAALLPHLECAVKDPMPVGKHGWQPRWHTLGKTMHSPWKDHAGEVLGYISKGYRHIALVRNPYDRVLAMYPNNKMPGESILQFMENPKRQAWLHPATAMADPAHVHFWIRFEHLQEDWQTLVSKFQLPVPNSLSHENKNPNKVDMTRQQAFADSLSVAHAQQKYAADFEYFGYDRTP